MSGRSFMDPAPSLLCYKEHTLCMSAPTNSSLKNISILWHTFRNYHLQIIILVALGIVSAILDGIGINAMIPLISFYTNASSGPTDFISQAIQGLFGFFHIPFSFRYLLAFILGLFMLRAVMITMSGYIRGRIGAGFMGRESEGMLKRMLHASWAFLLKQKIGTLQATLVRDIQRTENLLSVFGQIIQSFSGLFIYLLVALNISPIMTVSTLVVGVVLLFAVRPLMIRIRMALIRSISGSLFQPFSLIFVIILFAITYRLPDFSMISFAAALYLIQKIFTYLESGQGALNGIRESIPYAQNIDAFKRLLDEHREQETPDASPFAFERTIEFTNVSFSYAGGKSVLSEARFSIAKGETVGLIGPSGAGKTSVADLLLRLFSPNEGSIVIDGKPITSISSESWRSNIGYVAQDVFLLNASIEENIRFYRPNLSKEAIIEATKKANIYDFIIGLPEGFNTLTGDRGVMLSGGQRQRIALARALAGNPLLLILDEATSALDHESEKLIHESIRALYGTVTVLIIAHRPSTVAEADSILVLHHGRIIERGTPRELLQNPSSYFSKMQNT